MSEFPDLPVIMLSSMPGDKVSREYTEPGALGFIPKTGEDRDKELREKLMYHGLIADQTGTIIGCSKPVLLALRAARRAANTRSNLLIRGERGTGKELIA